MTRREIETLRADAVQMFEAGMEIPDIATELGVSVPTVYRYLKTLAVDQAPEGWDEAVRATGEIVRDYAEGVPISEIARRYGTTRYCVEKLLVAEGAHVGSRRKQAREDREKLVVEAYRSGARIVDIAEQHGISTSYVYTVLARHKIAPTRRRVWFDE